jgi:D-alanyl-D-alanine carboxypeptidase
MKIKYLLILAVLQGFNLYGQHLDTALLDELFNSLQNRNESMGTIAISRNGQLLYQRTFGYRYICNRLVNPIYQ